MDDACSQQVPRGRLVWNMDIHIIYVTVEHLNQVIYRKCIHTHTHKQTGKLQKYIACALSLLSHHNYYMRRNIKTNRKSLWKWELLLGYQWNIQKLEIHIIYYTTEKNGSCIEGAAMLIFISEVSSRISHSSFLSIALSLFHALHLFFYFYILCCIYFVRSMFAFHLLCALINLLPFHISASLIPLQWHIDEKFSAALMLSNPITGNVFVLGSISRLYIALRLLYLTTTTTTTWIHKFSYFW